MRLVPVLMCAGVLLTACGDTDEDEGSVTGAGTDEVVTVTGTLGGMTLEEGVCTWVETPDGKVEVWGAAELGQVVSFLPDDTFEGIRAVGEEGGVGEIVFEPGDRVTVTGTTYVSEPECGTYGVDATEPWTLA